MNKYKLTIFLTTCFIVNLAYAQFKTIEFHVAGTLNTISGGEPNVGSGTGFKIGVLTDVPVSHANWLKIGIVYHYTSLTDENIQSIIIPTYYKLRFAPNRFVYFGPEAHLYTNHIHSKAFTTTIKRSGDIVLTGGLEVELDKNINISLGTSIGLVKQFFSKPNWSGYLFSTSAGLGFTF